MFNTGTLNSIESAAGISSPDKPAELFVSMFGYIFGAAGIILTFNLLSSGLKMMTSAGDPKALSAAQAKLTTSFTGIFIMLISFYLVRFILQFFGIDFGFFNIV